MRKHERPALLEYAVFGSAFLLSLIVGYYSLKRFWAKTPILPDNPPWAALPESSPTAGASTMAAPSAAEIEASGSLRGSGTLPAVTVLPGAKESAPRRAKKKR